MQKLLFIVTACLIGGLFIVEILQGVWGAITDIVSNSGYAYFFTADGGFKNLIMILVAFCFLYLGIKKGFEPLLMVPIAFGMLLANIPGANLAVQYHDLQGFIDLMAGRMVNETTGAVCTPGLMDFLYFGVKAGVYPPLIFLGIGAMTDFAPLIANPSSFILGAAAQLGIFFTYVGAILFGFTPQQAGSIGIIGGADGPTAIFVTSKLAPELLGTIAVAAYSYMALVPVIQPPIMRALTTKKERSIVMGNLRSVSKLEKILFPIMVTVIVSLLLPDAATLVGMLMLGNLLKESGRTERIAKAAQNELMNIVTIMLGLSVGATTSAQSFLNLNSLFIVVLGLIAFSVGTAGGVLFGKIMCVLTKGKVNPLIGSAGVSAVPMAARVSQKVGQKENPSNFLLMHAMGPNVSGVIGSAVAAGVLLTLLK
ncbi:MAG: sodium ion-translocating decarboxylase subunit beta [Anaerotruncus sp.]|nr:sodium ion-translocating decarboxylase subunit beta [Anaerotruncus sp.]